jgi:cysteinyl-tRNA synthetase
MKLYNTMSRKKEEFKPIKNIVKIYSCGPTVYSRAHIGNLRAYIAQDILIRTLKFNEFKLKRVMNITDVGHLTSDADEGEDKIEKSSKNENLTAWQLAEKYTNLFIEDIKKLNILEPDIFCKATSHIKEQIALVEDLKNKGFTYETSDGIYFDTSKLKDYGKLAKLNIEGLEEGKRINIGEKKNKTDFALWKFSKEKRQMEWEAFGKLGFPGWHIECSAMAMKYLGETLDIHCGGIDHIQVHHTNEIAQSETSSGKEFSKFWFHNEFLVMKDGKMAKSEGNVKLLDDLERKNIHPLDYRYFCLNTHYRKQLMFSIEALESAKNAREKLNHKIRELLEINNKGETALKYAEEFILAINDDLNVPKALGIMWEMIDDNNISNESKLNTLYEFDNILGLDLNKIQPIIEEKIDDISIKWECNIDTFIRDLIIKRNNAKVNKNWKLSDEIRDEIKSLGFEVNDKKEFYLVKKS